MTPLPADYDRISTAERSYRCNQRGAASNVVLLDSAMSMFYFRFARWRQRDEQIAASLSDHDVRDLTATLSRLNCTVEFMLGLLAENLAQPARRSMHPVIEAAFEICQSRRDIEHRAMTLAARPSLPAMQLRHTMSAMRVASELEQVARLVASIGQAIGAMTASVPAHPLRRIAEMTLLVRDRFHALARGYDAGDVDAVLAVWRTDEAVDSVHNRLFAEILALISENTRNISFGAQLLLCIKSLERAGDHATNIAESVYYALTGQRILQERPKHDTTTIAASLPWNDAVQVPRL